MNGGEGVTAYLTRISAVRDELAAVGEKVAPIELVHTKVTKIADKSATSRDIARFTHRR